MPVKQFFNRLLEAAGHPVCREYPGASVGIMPAASFSKPAALFEKFPHKDRFTADKDGK
jgi:hypothetical protein